MKLKDFDVSCDLSGAPDGTSLILLSEIIHFMHHQKALKNLFGKTAFDQF